MCSVPRLSVNRKKRGVLKVVKVDGFCEVPKVRSSKCFIRTFGTIINRSVSQSFKFIIQIQVQVQVPGFFLVCLVFTSRYFLLAPKYWLSFAHALDFFVDESFKLSRH